jgi:lipopolysaccharide/colanic/teichoic acid biosynthesis glycosyltransferase
MIRILKQYYPVRNVVFVIGEFAVIYFSAILSFLIFRGDEAFLQKSFLPLNTLLIAITCQICLYYNDLYDLSVTDRFSELSIRLLQALGATAIILAGIYSLFPAFNIGLRVFMMSIGFDILFIVTWRFLYTLILNRKFFDLRIILLGSDHFAQDILKEILERKDCGYEVGGLLLSRDEDREIPFFRKLAGDSNIQILGNKNTPHFCTLIKAMDIRKIIVALNDPNDLPTKELLKCRVDGIDVVEGNSFYEMLTGKLIVDHLRPEWLIFSDGFRKPALGRIAKRLLDLLLSVLLLILLFPVILLVSLLVKLDRKEPPTNPRDIWFYYSQMCGKALSECSQDVGGRVLRQVRTFLKMESEIPASAIWVKFHENCAKEGIPAAEKLVELMKEEIESTDPRGGPKYPIFFSQERVGKDGRSYMVHKFRSMIPNAERYSGPVWAGENDKRITRIGNFMRKWRIDELPQLWNVLKGEMSFVGPRPERPVFVEQLERTIPYYRERLTVKPGLTGWAQVSYGYGASEDDSKEKLNYDLFYVKNMSLLFDLVIVLRTVKIVLFGKGR